MGPPNIEIEISVGNVPGARKGAGMAWLMDGQRRLLECTTPCLNYDMMSYDE